MKILGLLGLFFYLISKTNLSIMSIKPSVVFIKGVHSTTGHNTASDIGFPQLELEKLFEGATIKVTADTAYDSSKQYIYYSSPSNPVAIQDAGHFNCVKNGYYSIANGINHYYTKSGDDYNYNAVPSNVNTWAGKWSFNNSIKGKDLYSIDQEAERICIGNNTYYKKTGNNYVKQDIVTYNTYDNNISVSWGESNKYTAKSDFDENFDEITIWKTNNGTAASSGYYLNIDEKSNGTYIVQLLNLIFDEAGVLLDSDIDPGTLYKLPDDLSSQTSNFYIKNGNKFEELDVNQSSHTFTTSPATDNNFYIYQRGADWSYPNTKDPEYIILSTQDGAYVTGDFPLYTNATITGITKTWHDSYTIYEKTAVKINYNYSGDANSLKFIFTDKDIDGVLEACNLPNDIKKYVHLTNLKYNNK